MNRHSRRFIAGLIAVLAIAGTAVSALAFPTKPIRIIVTSAAGANLDVVTRALAEQMSRTLGQQVIVENVTGAGGLIAIRQVARQAPADGYTLLAASNTVALVPAFKKDPGYDPARDLVGIADTQTVPYILVGPASRPEKTLAEMLASAKAQPGALSIANGGIGTSTHLPALMLTQQAGINMIHVPYRGNANALPDVVGGRAHLLFDAGVTAIPMIRDGKLKAYGVSTSNRVSYFPNIPTLAEQGLPAYDFKAYMGLFAPAGTPKEVIARLHEAARAAARTDALRDVYQRGGSEPGTMSPDEFTAFIRRDAAASARIVSELGIVKD